MTKWTLAAGAVLALSLTACSNTKAAAPNSNAPAVSSTSASAAQSAGITAPSASAAFDFTPKTEEENGFATPLKTALDPHAGKKYDMIYWGTRAYKGLRIHDDEVRVAIDAHLDIPGDTLRRLAWWYGNMAGDPQGNPKYTWVLVDYRTGQKI